MNATPGWDLAAAARGWLMRGEPGPWPDLPDQLLRHHALAWLAPQAGDESEPATFAGLARLAALEQVTGAFREASIPFAALKGPVLAQQLHADPFVRDPGDLDLLVAPADAVLAMGTLRALGWSPPYTGFLPSHEPSAVRLLDELVFVRDGAGVDIDLQWRAAPAMLGYRLPVPQMLSRAQTVRIGALEVPALDAEDTALFLTIHGGKHGWEALGWLLDVAVLVRDGEVDWSLALQRARSAGAERPLLIGLGLVRELFGSEVPGALARALAQDREALAIVRWTAHRLRTNPAFGFDIVRRFRAPIMHYQLALLPGRWVRAMYLARRLVMVSVVDFAWAGGGSPGRPRVLAGKARRWSVKLWRHASRGRR